MIRNDSVGMDDSRYREQVKWTRPFREFLYQKLPQDRMISVLEVGCGTGAVLEAVQKEYTGPVQRFIGIDIDRNVINYTKNKNYFVSIQGKGEKLPFACSSFDFVFCHYLLLWVEDPVKILAEMNRVTAKGGICAVMAEPCYSEMTVKPKALLELAVLQRLALTERGADCDVGKMLPVFFRNAGFSNAKCGRYERNDIGKVFICQEIDQMLADTGKIHFDMDPNLDYDYHVPTYMGYAIKE